MSGARRIGVAVATLVGVAGVVAAPALTRAFDTASGLDRGPESAAERPGLDAAPDSTTTSVDVAGSEDTAIPPPPEEFDGAPAVGVPLTIESVASSTGAELFAVVVGINDYPGSNGDLTAAVTDARDTRRALEQFGVPSSNILSVTDRQATADGLRASIRWLADHAGPEDTAVFLYAGHVRKLGYGTEAIITADGRETTDEELAVMMAPLSARRAWIVIAACYGGGFTELLAPGRVLTAAAPANRIAYENQEFGRSYLVEYMVRRAWLQHRAPGSVEEAFSFAVRALERDHPDRVPFQVDHAEGLLTLASSGGAAVRAPSTPSAPPPAPDSDAGGTSPPPPTGGGDEDEGGCAIISLFCTD